MESWLKLEETKIDYAELYRQNYEDALDEIRNLKLRIKELEQENNELRKEINFEDNYILNRYKIFY
jgi:cell shape-determining protein MreC